MNLTSSYDYLFNYFKKVIGVEPTESILSDKEHHRATRSVSLLNEIAGNIR